MISIGFSRPSNNPVAQTIGRASVEGLWTIEGYVSDPSVAALRALGGGLGAGMAKGAKS